MCTIGESHAHLISIAGVFATGDCRRGQSRVVWAINHTAAPPAKSTGF